MTYINRTMIVTAATAPLARFLAETLAGPPAEGMWQTGLSPDGTGDPTHYVSSGPVAAEFGPVLTDAQAIFDGLQAAQQGGLEVPASVGVTLSDCEALVDSAVVVDLAEEGPFDTFARLGLRLSENPDPE